MKTVIIIITLLLVITPWPFVYIWTTPDFKEWTAIAIGGGQVLLIMLLLGYDEWWLQDYKKKNRRI